MSTFDGMLVVVTGAAGFIGSALAERLVADGHHVRGIDCFTPYYHEAGKRRNLVRLLDEPSFELVTADLREASLAPMLDGAAWVLHQAGQPGVRLSWADGFADYDSHNVLVTQRLLEESVAAKVRRFVFASSSSVYGNAETYPATEDALPQPYSPYGVTKLAAEHLCGLYARNWDLATVALRYFTVYGPRQRPDMGIRRLVDAALGRRPFPLFGDGSHVRDFTFVDDVVCANLAACEAAVPAGTVMNIAGGGNISVRELIEMVAEISGQRVEVECRPEQPGDVKRTGGSTALAAEWLGWSPRVPLAVGIERQVAWQATQPVTAGSVS